ncbi:MAG: hypothetical protein OXU66_00850 [Gammaproteobacteria bacterium]|nr:hypothetical protein [Gammaproteobacteria bacterium]MDD9895045.1 hypothetical protein [Gammaproteobacteria bacterium]MDD9957463.1 hypothetical protein [Gammaproteobacteria bacterium]
MLSRLIDVSGWTPEQWLAACILAFIVVTVVVVLHRSLKIFQMANKKSYQPNLRPLRRARLKLTPTESENDAD